MLHTDINYILSHHRGLLLDAYGVLVAGDTTLPGATALIARLKSEGRPFAVVTNDASAHPETLCKKYAAMGIELEREQLFSSGYLVVPYFHKHQLQSARTWVLGPSDVERMVRDAGGTVEAPSYDEMPDVIVCADESGYDFLPTVETVISMLFKAQEKGHPVRLLLPNPDRIFPQAEGRVGLAAGSIALIIDDALKRRFGENAMAFETLGKPEATLFLEAQKMLDEPNLCMIGDQLETDVLGAKRAGLFAAIVATGIGRVETAQSECEPDYVLSSLKQ